jgi:arylformamidase
MPLRWKDITIPMRPGMTVWPGDAPFEFQPSSRISQGAGCNVSKVSFSTHVGTHCDAPWHFEDAGKRVDQIDSSVFFGDATLIEIPNVDAISADDLGSSPLPARILLKTKNSAHPANGPFRADYVAVAADAAQRMADEGVRFVGVDYLSVAPFKQPGQDTHHILLSNDIFVVEGLLLDGFRAGVYPVVVLPMLIEGADGAPCRAFIGVEE